MKLEAEAKFLAGAADATVGAIATHVLDLARRQSDVSQLGKRILLAMDGTSAETVTLDLWAVDDATDEIQRIPQPDSPVTTNRVWYRFATGVVVTGTRITEVTAAVPAGGLVYAQRTADAIVALETRTLKATCLP